MSDEIDQDESAVEGDRILSDKGFDKLFLPVPREREHQLSKYREYVSTEVYADHLTRALKSFVDAQDLRTGDLVQWKTILKAE